MIKRLFVLSFLGKSLNFKNNKVIFLKDNVEYSD